MRIIAFIQARMGSTRLPGKVLMDIGGKPMVTRVVERVRRARAVSDVVLLTSSEKADDHLAAYAAANSIPLFRGSEVDVLDRFHAAAALFPADAIVRITADCPLIDPETIDRVVNEFVAADADYATNVLVPSYPDGLDVEVIKASALAAAWKEAGKQSEREHVTSYIRNSERFCRRNVKCATGDFSRERWTVDDADDLLFVRAVYQHLGPDVPFGFSDIIRLLNERPDIRHLQSGATMNEGYYKTLYRQAAAGAAPKRTVTESLAWHARATRVIPGASQTFSKSTSQYVQGVSPIFLQRGEGCRVWDVDGNEYVDYVQGLLPNILGYAHPDVNAAAAAQYAQGHSFSLPHPIEVELAERLTRLIPCAEMVRFGKNGSDAMAGAVRAARAHTGRNRVACCGYHGWQDWYIGSTSRHKGVPPAVRELVHSFPYNDLAALRAILEAHPGEFAAVTMEPANFVPPQPGYLQGVKNLAHEHGALLVFDEICSGFHFGLGGAQKRFGVTPDLAAFGKAMGNGYPIAVVVGRADVMKVFDEVFFSFTLGGEAGAMAASMKVLDILEQGEALPFLEAQGRRLQDGFNALAKEAGLSPRFQCIGFPFWSLLKFRDAAGKDSFLERSLWQQECVKRGVLQLVTHNMTAAHDNSAVEQTLETYAAVFKTLSGWLADPKPERFLEGPMIQPIFRVR
jgi:glutamate-1-semialdehyde 2,1-aminomutase/spore coat polysaccharide biosynthesis protein SpsF